MIMYTTSWCGFCHRLKRQLERDGVAFREVDIERDQAAARLVMSLNQGNATVPTVVFADGSSATNPSAAEVRSRIAGG